eukprot:288314-Pleurochrysis_carterae.AAC.2
MREQYVLLDARQQASIRLASLEKAVWCAKLCGRHLLKTRVGEQRRAVCGKIVDKNQNKRRRYRTGKGGTRQRASKQGRALVTHGRKEESRRGRS